MYRALVSSVLPYGSETWNLTTRYCNRLNDFDMNCLRRLENVKCYHHVRNITIRQQTEQRPVSNTFGHLQRMSLESVVLKLHNLSPGTIGWTRPRGPSTTTVVGLRNSRPRSHQHPPPAESVHVAHRLACRSSYCDLYVGQPARALSQVRV